MHKVTGFYEQSKKTKTALMAHDNRKH